MQSMNCANCMYAERSPGIGPDGEVLIGQEQLVCQRMPPQCVMISVATPAGMQHGLRTQFPPVSDQMFCYEYAPDEEGDALADTGTLSDDVVKDIITGKPIN